MKVHLTINLPNGIEYERVENVSHEVFEKLADQLHLPPDWTSLVVIISNPEPTP
jgi:tRNA U34 5-carboxymethylaminomethyl modifying enzyme MnmG/GidA